MMNIELPFDIQKLLAMPIHLYWKDRDGLYLGCNDFMAENLCLQNTQEIIGLDDQHTIITNESAQLYQAQDEKIIETQTVSSFIDWGNYKENELLTFATIKFPIHTSNNKPAGVLGISLPLGNNIWQILRDMSLPDEMKSWLALNQSKKTIHPLFLKLSRREIECLYWLIRGHSAKSIANQLMLSKRTVEGYIINIKTKLNCYNYTELVEFSLDNNYLNYYKEGTWRSSQSSVVVTQE